MNYGLDVSYQLPDLVAWSNTQNQRIDQRAKERNDAYRNLMQMLGRGVGAYKMNRDYNDWKADQNMWNSELNDINALEAEYDAAQDQYDIDAADRLIANMYNSNPYALPGNVGADQEDYALYQLGLL